MCRQQGAEVVVTLPAAHVQLCGQSRGSGGYGVCIRIALQTDRRRSRDRLTQSTLARSPITECGTFSRQYAAWFAKQKESRSLQAVAPYKSCCTEP